MFQSSPGMGAGRNVVGGWLELPGVSVSILARHGSRAQLVAYYLKEKLDNVSILARHGSRAQLPAAAAWGRTAGCFNPRPAWEPGATPAPLGRLSRYRCFNPRPAWEPGATQLLQRSPLVAPGFNPRPAWEPGATNMDLRRRSPTSVSILARHGSRAQRLTSTFISILSLFQSSPGMGAGRNCRRLRPNWPPSRFQSSPGMGAGRNPPPGTGHNRHTAGFNPRPAWEPGATYFFARYF